VTRRPTRPSSLSLLPLTPSPSSLPPPSLFESLLTYSDNHSTTSLYDGHHRRRPSPCARPDPLHLRLRGSPSSSRRRLHRHQRASLGLRHRACVRPSFSTFGAGARPLCDASRLANPPSPPLDRHRKRSRDDYLEVGVDVLLPSIVKVHRCVCLSLLCPSRSLRPSS